MSRSWDHRIRLLTQDERDYLERQHRRYGDRYYTCASRGCVEEAVYATGYMYVTGRRGRVTAAERNACAEHGRRFAERYKIELPAEEAGRETRTGYMAVSDALSEIGSSEIQGKP